MQKRASYLLGLTIKIIIITLCVFTLAGCGSKDSPNHVNTTKKIKPFTYSKALTYEDVSNPNPLKGFVALDNEETTFPSSLKYFDFSVKRVQVGYNEFDWRALESALEQSKREGKQAIIRFYLDYPGRQSGIPDFLIKDGLKTYSYTVKGHKGLSPDYSNKKLKEALINFVIEFGKKYDGDSRIGFIEAGLLGFWGGWHTDPYDNLYPTKDLYKSVGSAYATAFKKTHVMIGEIEASTTELNLGYHDDAFTVDTLAVSKTMSKYNVSNRWLTNPIGAELEREVQDDFFKTPSVKGTIDFNEAISLIHPSWCINNAILIYDGVEREKAIEAGNKLGYNFTVNNAEVNYNDNNLQVCVGIINTGNAPFYYDWNIELRITDSSGNEILVEKTDWSLRSITELNKEQLFKYDLKNVQFNSDSTYTLSMKVINPMEGGKSLYFANKEQKEDGWLDLITMTINN